MEAGLPDIEGTLIPWGYRGNPETGAFLSEGDNYLSYDAKGINAGKKTTFKASRWNPIYGKSDSVIPETMCMHYVIKY